MDNIKSIVIEYCIKNNIKYVGIILHGSQATGFSNEHSDYDLLIITEKTFDRKIDTFLSKDRLKIQIEFMSVDALENELKSYETKLFHQITDLNIMAGRILDGIILQGDDRVKNMITTYGCYREKNLLIKRFLYTATNYYTDTKTTDIVLKRYAYEVISLCIGTAILIKNDIFLLHTKWQHRFLEKIMNEEDFQLYLSIRFLALQSNNHDNDDIKKLIQTYL